MRACVQRVSTAQVVVDGQVVGKIETGLLVLLGVAQGDEERDARMLAEKLAGLRIFNDQAGKMNLALADIGGARQLEQRVHRLLVDAILRIVEIDAASLERQSFAALRVAGEKLAQMFARDRGVMGTERAPSRGLLAGAKASRLGTGLWRGPPVDHRWHLLCR